MLVAILGKAEGNQQRIQNLKKTEPNSMDNMKNLGDVGSLSTYE
jgi:hypothetical protein